MKTAIVNATVINENRIYRANVIIENSLISAISPADQPVNGTFDHILDASGMYLLPGAIDTHVHFRQPGMEYKATIGSESKAALAGGVTTFLDMPNTKPPAVDQETLQQKISIARNDSWINYGFYVAVTDENYRDINGFASLAAGIKLFYGATTGNLLFNDKTRIRYLFETARLPIAIHSESQQLLEHYSSDCGRQGSGKLLQHLRCRPHEVCINATKELLSLHEGTGAHLHFLHVTTAQEANLLTEYKLRHGNVSFELCPHYLVFSAEKSYGLDDLLKVNPAIKNEADRQALINALAAQNADTIGTDHAPHLLDEKQLPYDRAPSGLPSVEHYLPAVFRIFSENNLPLSYLPTVTSHNPARIFGIKKRGFIRPGYKADLVLVKKQPHTAGKSLHRCGWSVYDGFTFDYAVDTVFVNGRIAYGNGQFAGRPAVEHIA